MYELFGPSEALLRRAQRQAMQRDAGLTPAGKAFMPTTPSPGELPVQADALILGTLPDGQQFPISQISLLRSIMLVGPLRTGKSTLLLWLAFLLQKLGVPLLLFDQKLTLYPEMVRAMGQDRVAQLAMDQMPLNLIEPYGATPLQTSINDSIELLGSASRRLRANESLNDVIAALMPNMPAGEYPELVLFISETEKLLNRSKGRDRDLVLGLRQSLKQLQQSVPDVFKYRKTNTLEVLLSPRTRAVVIEDPGMPAWVYLFIVGLILRRAYTHRKVIGLANVTGPVVVASDDATDLLDEAYDKAALGNASPIAGTLKICAEYQIGFWSAVHNLGSLSSKQITHTKSFIFSGVDGRDLQVIQQLLGLNREQLDAMRLLQQDEYVAFIPDTYPRPVLIRMTPPWMQPAS